MLLTDAVERIIVLIVQYKQNLSMGKGAVTMILVNTDYITGKELEMLGLVKGSTIQSKNIGRDISQVSPALIPECFPYTLLCKYNQEKLPTRKC